jgi:small multidrug resistance pump
MPLSLVYLTLAAAIVAEIIATTALGRSESFTRLVPSLITVLGYCVAFFLLSFPLRVMPVGIVYAIWSGVGIVFITAVGWLWLGQRIDLAAMIGLAFITVGVVIVNVFSKSVVH